MGPIPPRRIVAPGLSSGGGRRAVPDPPFAPSLSLAGQHVALVPLTPEHAPALVPWLRDPAVLQYFRAPPGRSDVAITDWIHAAFELGRSGSVLPFTTILRSTSTPIGMTQFLRIDRPNRGVEIGSTWVAAPFWRTPVNTEAKWLMLRYAFEVANFHRVQLQTDLRNVRSQRAIAGLGAWPEARLREDVLLPDGSFRTSVYFSLLEEEWPTARAGLERRLLRAWSAPDVRPAPPAVLAPATPSPPRANSGPTLEFRPPISLSGPHVSLLPLNQNDLPALTAAGAASEIWPLLSIRHGDTPEGMAGLVDGLLRAQAAGEVLPFTVRLGSARTIVGIARFLDIDRPNRWVEVGTWLHPSLWRTPVNTELKLLLLRHAFEAERVHRVQLKTDHRNLRSQGAIERLGAVFEGERRDHFRFPEGTYRTSKYYGILDREWPTVRARLESFLERPWPPLSSPLLTT
jgi:N-acetyltransferase